MGNLGKLIGSLFRDKVIRVLLVVVLGYAAYDRVNISLQSEYVSSYETIKDVDKLPPFSISENESTNELQTNPAVIRLHTGKVSYFEKVKQLLLGNEMPKDNEFFCTAFVISDNYAITAGHCLDENGELRKEDVEVFVEYAQDSELPSYKDSGVKVKAVGINRRGDTGVLYGDFSTFRKLLFSPDPNVILQILKISMYTGGQLISIGFPYGDAPLTIPVTFIGGSEFKFQGKTLLYPGMSGGPLIEPNTGYVIGVNSSVGYNSDCFFSSLVGLLESLNIKTAP